MTTITATESRKATNSFIVTAADGRKATVSFPPNPYELAKICENADELNMLIHVMGRKGFSQVLYYFEGVITVEEMYMLDEMSDFDEYFFTTRYPLYAARKANTYKELLSEERRSLLADILRINEENGYATAQKIAQEKSIKAPSEEEYREIFLKHRDHLMRNGGCYAIPITEFKAHLYALEEIFDDSIYNPKSPTQKEAMDEFLKKMDYWRKEANANPVA